MEIDLSVFRSTTLEESMDYLTSGVFLLCHRVYVCSRDGIDSADSHISSGARIVGY